MDSYLEVTLLNAVIVILFSLCTASYLSIQPLSWRKMLIYTLFITLFGVVLWNDWSLWFMIAMEIILFFSLFRWHMKCYVFAYTIRMLLFFAEYAFLKGSFHNLLYFVPMRCAIILFWVVLLLGLVFLFANGKLFLCAMQYSYPFTLYTADTKLKLIGYLDSGNLATYHQIPIIFLDQRYCSYFTASQVDLVILHSVSGVEITRVYEARIKLENGICAKVYVNVEKTISKELGAACILNRNIFMVR